MTDETKTRVVLDTTQAKAALSGLVREAQSAAGRVSSGVRSAVSRGLGVVGPVATFDAGVRALVAPTSGGIGDVMSEAFGGIGKQLEEFFLGDMGMEARSKRASREEAIQAFGAVAGHTGKIPPGAKAWFDNVQSLRMQEEKGRHLFETNEQFRGPGVGDLVDRIMTRVGEELSKAVDALVSKLAFWK